MKDYELGKKTGNAAAPQSGSFGLSAATTQAASGAFGQSSGFSQPAGSTGFGATTGFGFGGAQQQQQPSGLFGAKPVMPAFGQHAQPAPAAGFGFGQAAAPAAAKPAFGFNVPQTTAAPTFSIPAATGGFGFRQQPAISGFGQQPATTQGTHIF